MYESFTKDAYDTQMVIYNYWEVVESAYLEKIVNEPSEEMLKGLTEEQILGCIAWHFRADHFNNGSLSISSDETCEYYNYCLVGGFSTELSGVIRAYREYRLQKGSKLVHV